MAIVAHRAAGTPGNDTLQDPAKRAQLIKFLLSIDASTPPISPADAVNVTITSAATDIGPRLAPESIGSAYGTGLAVQPAGATVTPPPVALVGTTASVRDSACPAARPAFLCFAQPGELPASRRNGAGHCGGDLYLGQRRDIAHHGGSLNARAGHLHGAGHDHRRRHCGQRGCRRHSNTGHGSGVRGVGFLQCGSRGPRAAGAIGVRNVLRHGAAEELRRVERTRNCRRCGRTRSVCGIPGPVCGPGSDKCPIAGYAEGSRSGACCVHYRWADYKPVDISIR